MRLSIIRFVVLIGLGLTLSAYAAQKTWMGPASGGVWSTDGNWSPIGKPIAGDGVTFNSVTSSTADLGAVAITNITITNLAEGTVVNGAVTINASPVPVNVDSAVNATVNASIAITNANLFIRNSVAGKSLKIKGVLSGGTGVRIYGPGEVEFVSNSSNTYTLLTVVSSMDGLGGAAGNFKVTPLVNNANLVPGDLSILTGGKATMSFGNGIADTSIVNIDTGGLFDLNGTAEIIAQLTGTGTVSLGNSISPLVILTVGDSNSFTFGGSIIGTGTLQKNGTGAMTLSGNNSFVGPTKVQGGTLRLQSPQGGMAIPGDLTLVDTGNSSAAIWLASDQIADTSKVTVGLGTTINLNGVTDTIGSLSATGNVNLNGGKLTVAGTLNMNDNGTISGGAGSPLLTLGGDVNVTFTSAASSAAINCPVLMNATRVFTVPSLATCTFTLGGVISGVGGLTKAGSGTMLIASTGSQFTGTTTVVAGTLQLNGSATAAIIGPLVIGNDSDPAGTAVVRNLANADITGDVTVNASGQWDCNNFGQNIGALNGAGKMLIGTSTCFLGFGDKPGSFSGVISGTGTVNKAGTGVQTFTGKNTYSGTTFVNSGELTINGQQTGSFQVASGAKLSGTGKVGGIFNSGTLAPSGAPFSTGSVTMAATSKLDLNLSSTTPGAFSALKMTGVLTINAGAMLNFTAGPGVGLASGTKFVLIDNDLADAITGTFANAAEGSVLPVGAQQLKISYVGGTGNDMELTAQNIAPVINSAVNAAPSPVGPGQTVTFTVAANDANLDTLAYAWNFGDGANGSGASTTHTYTAPGNYNVTVTITDGQGGLVQSSTSVAVAAPLVGEGLDSDGDGFSDAFETAAKSDPLIAGSTPTGAVISVQPLVVSKLGISLNFAKSNSDAITLSGTVTVPSGFAPAGKIVVFDVGGVTQGFTLTSKGKGVSGKTSCSFGVKAGTQKYALKLTKGSFASALMDEGLIEKNDPGSMHGVVCSLSFNGGIFQLNKTVTYKAKVKKTGTAK